MGFRTIHSGQAQAQGINSLFGGGVKRESMTCFMGENIYVGAGTIKIGEDKGISVLFQKVQYPPGAFPSLASTSKRSASIIRLINSAVSGDLSVYIFRPASMISSLSLPGPRSHPENRKGHPRIEIGDPDSPGLRLFYGTGNGTISSTT